MRMKLNKYLLLLFLYIVCTMSFTTISYATNETAESEAAKDLLGGFSYRVVTPENQHSQAGYFDLRVSPSQEQKVQIDLINDSSKEMTIGISLNSAKTNANGVIEYGPTAIEDDESLVYNFKDIVKAPEKVVIPAGSTVPLELSINMPADSFDGKISGGIQLKQVIDEKDQKKDSQTGIINEYAYMVGMILTETDNIVEPDLKLNKVYAGLSNYRNSVFLDVSNFQAEYLNDLTTDVQIMKKGSSEILYDTKKAGMRMAPNSKMLFPISMNGDKMTAGDYTAHILMTSGEKKWEWTEDFTITDEEADKFNGQDVSLTQDRKINWLLIVAIVVGMIIFVVVVFFIVKMIKKNKVKKRKSKKKKKSK